MEAKANKRQEPGTGRAEQAQKHPGPDPVHPEASKPVPGKSPADVRRMQERRVARERDAG
uniref:Uncharacterized protein n=1 Tax=Streptomyces sp. NBC_00049 TaxID=2903617 RepID=A0AAU2K1N0_9ACTN